MTHQPPNTTSRVLDACHGMRRCSICKQEFPATTQYFHVARHKNERVYLTSRCKPCDNAYTKQQREGIKGIYTTWAVVEQTQKDMCFVLANCQCARCREWYAPYAELWATSELCAYCKEDIDRAARRTAKVRESANDERP